MLASPAPSTFFDVIECDLCETEYPIRTALSDPEDVPIYWKCESCQSSDDSENDASVESAPITEYERARLDKMAQNRAMLVAIVNGVGADSGVLGKKRTCTADDEYSGGTESSDESEEVVRPAKRRAGKIIVRAPQPTNHQTVANDAIPFAAFQRLIDEKPMIRAVAELSNPANFPKLRKLIVDEYAGAWAPPCFGPVQHNGQSVYLMSLDLAFEYTFYFQSAMPGRYIDMEGALKGIGTLWPNREIPKRFAIGKMAEAKTFVIDADILAYVWKRFAPFQDEELRAAPARRKRQGNSSVVNLGHRYVVERARPEIPSSPVMNAMMERGLMLDSNVGFVCVIVQTLGDLAVQPSAPFLRAAAVAESARADSSHKQHAYFADLFPRTGTMPLTDAALLPTTQAEADVSMVYGTCGKILSLPSVPDNGFVAFEKRKRPKTDFPYTTISFAA